VRPALIAKKQKKGGCDWQPPSKQTDSQTQVLGTGDPASCLGFEGLGAITKPTGRVVEATIEIWSCIMSKA